MEISISDPIFEPNFLNRKKIKNLNPYLIWMHSIFLVKVKVGPN